MKHLKTLPTLAVALLFLTSCNGGKEKTSETTVSADSTSTSTPATESTVITTPQNVMLVTHKVADFTKWKTGYEAHDSMRTASGLHNYVIGRGVEDSNTVLVAIKVDDVAKAKAFAKDPGLKTAMQKSGVIGTPSIMINTMVYQDTSKNMSPLRSITMFTVKDWDAWKKSFESNRKVRTDNGLTDRAYGYDVDDNHKVTLVVAINDTAKANAYWHSDLIKQKRAEAGVVGDVKRFVYHVVKKY